MFFRGVGEVAWLVLAWELECKEELEVLGMANPLQAICWWPIGLPCSSAGALQVSNLQFLPRCSPLPHIAARHFHSNPDGFSGASLFCPQTLGQPL